jgi:hypothetical protein
MNLTVAKAFALVLLLAAPCSAWAQTTSAAAPPADQSDQLLSAGELDALVAPIALYPDALIAEMLMASTYPLEVVEADRWAKANKNLKGDELKAALDKQSWDDSLKALVVTPEALDMMSNRLDWTRKLGDAMLAQQPDVMDAIQRLRLKAQANNKLSSTPQQTVSVQHVEGGKQYIAIAPTQPDTMYMPYYDPGVVYGDWAYPSYPPYSFGYPGYLAGGLLATGLAFGAGYALGNWGGYGWGAGGNNINWSNNNVNIGNGNRNWSHNAVHRDGVRYNNRNVADRFGGNRNVGGRGAQGRGDFRGRGGQQVLNAGNRGGGGLGAGNRPGGGVGAGNRPGNRPSAGNRPGNRPSAGNRPGNRPSAGNRPGNRPGAGNRPSAGNRAAFNRPGGGSGGAFGGMGSGNRAAMAGNRGRSSLGGGGFGGRGGGGGFRGGGGRGGGGGVRRGGGGGGRGGGGRRSDMRLKHDVVLLGHLDDGLGFYRFTYNGGHQAYVGVIAQEVQSVVPEAVINGRDGYLRVDYGMLHLRFETYAQWVAEGARVPTGMPKASVDPLRSLNN